MKDYRVIVKARNRTKIFITEKLIKSKFVDAKSLMESIYPSIREYIYSFYVQGNLSRVQEIAHHPLARTIFACSGMASHEEAKDNRYRKAQEDRDITSEEDSFCIIFGPELRIDINICAVHASPDEILNYNRSFFIDSNIAEVMEDEMKAIASSMTLREQVARNVIDIVLQEIKNKEEINECRRSS